MAIVAVSQITLVDLTDVRSLQVFISSNRPTFQLYDVDNNTYIPNWNTMPLVLTPSLYVSGETDDKIGEALTVEWFKNNVPIDESTDNHFIGSGYSLTVNSNMMELDPFVSYTIRVTYYDDTTGVTIEDTETIQFTKIDSGASGENAQVAYLLTPDGTVFKNDKQTDRKRLEVKYFNGPYEENTGLIIKWFYADPTVEVGDPNYDPDGGTGWSKISSTNDRNGSYTNYNTKILSVSRNGVDGTETFKAMVSHQGKPFYSALGTIVDIFDPHQVVIEGDNVFKNGQGTLKLKARVFLDSEEVLDLTDYTFLWTAYNSDGVEVSTFNKTTQEIEVLVSEVPVKGYLACDVFKI